MNTNLILKNDLNEFRKAASDPTFEFRYEDCVLAIRKKCALFFEIMKDVIPLSQKYLSLAVVEKNKFMTEYFLDRGMKPCSVTMNYAAQNGSACLKLLHERGGELLPGVTHAAAQNMKIGSLKYAIRNGCEWDKRVCAVAVSSGNVTFIKGCLDLGCPRTKEGLEKTIVENKLALFILFLENGFEITIDTLKKCISLKRLFFLRELVLRRIEEFKKIIKCTSDEDFIQSIKNNLEREVQEVLFQN